MKKLMYGLAPILLLLGSTSMAADVAIVAKVINVQGNAVLERGNAHFALENNMSLIEGDKLIVLDKGTVGLIYRKSSCQISHPQNTLLTVADATQCVKGANFGMGAPNVGIGAGTGSGAGTAGVGTAGVGTAGVGTAGVSAAGAGAAAAGAAGAGAAAAGAAGAATVGGIAAAAGGLSIATVAAGIAAVGAVAAAAGSGGGSNNDNTPVSP